MIDNAMRITSQKESKLSYQRTAVILVIVSAFSRLFGFAREVLMTKYFGSSSETDAFFFAVTISQFFSVYLVSAVSQTFIPVLSEVDADESADTQRFTNNIIHIILLISIALLLLATIFIRPLTGILAQGIARNSPEAFELTVKLSRITMISILFPGIVGVFSGYLRYNRRFLTPAMIGIPLNAAYLFYLVFFSDRFGIFGLTWASVIAGLAQFLFLLPSISRSQFQYKPLLDFKDPYVIRMGKLSIPVIFSSIVSEASTIVDKSLATWLPAGSVTYLTYGGLINTTILVIFISSILTIIFPIMSQAFAHKELDRAHRYLRQAYSAVLIVIIPLSIFLAVFSKEIVTILFQRGRFDRVDTLNTAKIVSYYSLSLPAFSFMRITTNAYHANKDTRTPALFSILLLIFNVLFTLLFIKHMGAPGIALASGISSTIVTTSLIVLLKKKQGYNFANKDFLITLGKVVLASSVCLIFMLFGRSIFQCFIMSSRLRNLLFIALSLLALLIFFLLGILLKIDEFHSITKSIKSKIFPNKTL